MNNPQQGRNVSFVALVSTVASTQVRLASLLVRVARITEKIVATHLGQALQDLRSNPLYSYEHKKSYDVLMNGQPRLA